MKRCLCPERLAGSEAELRPGARAGRGAPHPGAGRALTTEPELFLEAIQPSMMLMTSRGPGEDLGSLLSCRGCGEPGCPLGLFLLHSLSRLRCPSVSVFYLTQLWGVELTVAEKLRTKTRIREACVLVPAPSALPLTTGVTVGKSLLFRATVSLSIK